MGGYSTLAKKHANPRFKLLTLSLFLVSCSVWPPSLLEAAFFFCYSSTALAGGYSCVTLTLTLGSSPTYGNRTGLKGHSGLCSHTQV